MIYYLVFLLLFILFIVVEVFPPGLKAFSHFVTIPVPKVLFIICRISLYATLVANHVILGSLTTPACFLFLADAVVLILAVF